MVTAAIAPTTELRDPEAGESVTDFDAVAEPPPPASPPPKWVTIFKWIGYVAVGLAVTSIVVLIVFYATDWGGSKPDEIPTGKRAMHLEDVYNGRLIPKEFRGHWQKTSTTNDDDTLVHINSDGHLVAYNPLTNSDEILLSNTTIGLSTSHRQLVSADGRFVLLEQWAEKRFAHSRRSRYQLFAANGTQPLAHLKAIADDDLLDYATFGPRGNQIAFVQRQNLYYIPSASRPAALVAVTNSTDADVFNGICDWAYEEEIFERTDALWFAPDGGRLAYAQFDDRDVGLITMHHFLRGGQYSVPQPIRYPKVGTRNPHVRLLWVELPEEVVATATTTIADRSVELPVPTTLQTLPIGDAVLTAIDWTAADRVLAVWMNRQQNRAYVQEYDTKTTTSLPNGQALIDVHSSSGWLSIAEPLFIDRRRNEIALIADVADRKQIVAYSMGGDRAMRQLTGGDSLNVDRIVHWSGADGAIFFLGNDVEAPQTRQLYVQLNGTVQCLTCATGFEAHSHYDALFAANGNHLVLIAEGPAVPRSDVYVWLPEDVSIRRVHELETNAQLRHLVHDTIEEPQVRYMEVPLNATNLTARVRLQLPSGFNDASAQTYPLLVYVYAGPGTYSGTTEFTRWLAEYSKFMATNRSVIVAQIDGRGTARRDLRTMHAVYGRLGQLEVADQIAVAGRLARTLGYVDATRIGIWGWSYGGYMTGMVLAADVGRVFRCGASVSPVTDWTRYDTLYTERFMGLEPANAEGYRKGCLMERAEALRDRRWLLVHGTGDDNVHVQHSMELVRRLELADIEFEQMVFPDEDHMLPHVEPFLYRRLTDFFDRCFAPTSEDTNQTTHV